MVSWWVTHSYFNNEPIQIGDIEIMTSTYGSSGSFVLRISSKSIGHDTFTIRRRYFRSKISPIHGTVHKSYLNYSHSISHFSVLPKAVAKN